MGDGSWELGDSCGLPSAFAPIRGIRVLLSPWNDPVHRARPSVFLRVQPCLRTAKWTDLGRQKALAQNEQTFCASAFSRFSSLTATQVRQDLV